jgi:hypothetical protein
VRACMRVCVRRCAIAPTHEVAEVTDEAEREAYERAYCTPRPNSGGVVGRSATSGCSTAVREMRNPAASALPCRRVRPDRGDERAPIHCPEGDHAGLSTQAAPHCASGTKAAPPRPRRESARFPQPSMGSRSARRSLRNGAWVCLHRCERRQAVRPAASPALHEHRPRSAQRRRLRTIAAT